MGSWLKMNPSTYVLTRGELASLKPGARACRICCVAGKLWVTAGGRREDYLLAPGEGVMLTGGGTIVVEALRTSTVRLEVQTPARGRSRALFPLAGPLAP